MKAITLWPEWAYAICALGKRVENRSWEPGRALRVGDKIAIHAGKNIGGRPGQAAFAEAGLNVIRMHRLANDGAAPAAMRTALQVCPRSAIVAVATVAGFDQEQRTGWDVPGSWHWRLSDVVVFANPIQCTGAQGLWTPSDDIQGTIAARLEAA